MLYLTYLDATQCVLYLPCVVDNNHSHSSHITFKHINSSPQDTHPEELTTTAFAQECQQLFQNEPTVTIEEIVGTDLLDKGYGGIYNVGKAATHPPRLIIMTYDPTSKDTTESNVEAEDAKQTIALVGKGIVYDTGGLAIKSKTGMCGMKSDMAGAAGVRESFLFCFLACILLVLTRFA